MNFSSSRQMNCSNYNDCYGSLRITSPVPLSSGTLRGSEEEEAAQSNLGGGVCKMSSLRRISLG